MQGKSKLKPPIGLIMGGALGALTVICITVLLILYLRRRQREGHSNKDTSARPRSLITPYNFSQAPQYGSRWESFVGTETRTVTTTKAATSSLAHTTRPAPVVAITLSRSDTNNLVSVGGTLPNSGDFANNPPPPYRSESFWPGWIQKAPLHSIS